MASQTKTGAWDEETLRKMFNAFDKDSDNKIEMKELPCVLKCLFVAEPDEASLKRCLELFDKDGSGAIEFEEFVNMLKELQKSFSERESLWKVFNTFDKDGDGHLTEDEIKCLLTQQGIVEENDEKLDQKVKKCIDELDTNRDGKVSFKEFCELFATFPSPFAAR